MDSKTIKAMTSSAKVEWGTPDDLYQRLDAKFHFTLDPCASDTNHKCATYFTKETDGLKQNWFGHRVFMNPPYGRKVIRDWVEMAYTVGTDLSNTGGLAVGLLPARVDTRWFHKYVIGKAHIWFIKSRLKFIDCESTEQNKKKNSALFPSIVCLWQPSKFYEPKTVDSFDNFDSFNYTPYQISDSSIVPG